MGISFWKYVACWLFLYMKINITPLIIHLFFILEKRKICFGSIAQINNICKNFFSKEMLKVMIYVRKSMAVYMLFPLNWFQFKANTLYHFAKKSACPLQILMKLWICWGLEVISCDWRFWCQYWHYFILICWARLSSAETWRDYV